MASAISSVCVSLGVGGHCSLTQTLKSPIPQACNLSFFSGLRSFPSHKLSLQSTFSPRLLFSSLPKSSESEAALTESEPEAPLSEAGLQPSESEATTSEPEPQASEPEAAEIIQPSSEQPPKRDGVFAVVMIGSHQYIVIPGRYIYTQRLKGANVNDKIALHKVLLVGTRTSTYIGKPVVTNAVIHATVEEQGRDPKIIVFKYKKKKKYRRTYGHRQPHTRIRINSITGYEDYPAVTLDSLNS